jgi:hypothetical protein
MITRAGTPTGQRRRLHRPPETWTETGMPRSTLPPEARKLRWALYGDPDSDAIRGLPLQKGVTEALFADLVVGCIWNYLERATRFKRHESHLHRRLLNQRGVRAIKRSARSWPFAAWHAERALANDAARRAHHDDVVAGARIGSRLFDPVICLYALFRYLVEPKPGETRKDEFEGIEYYVRKYFPRILAVAGLRPQRAAAWRHDSMLRRFRRYGGKTEADRVAFYMFSTDDRLKPYRPAPPPHHPQSGPPDPDLIASIMGRALFRLPESSNATPPKPSRGGQPTHRSA